MSVLSVVASSAAGWQANRASVVDPTAQVHDRRLSGQVICASGAVLTKSLRAQPRNDAAATRRGNVRIPRHPGHRSALMADSIPP
jgi:hypothetical protein